MEEDRLNYLIRRSVVNELMNLEERKLARKEQAEILRKKKLAEEEAEENEEKDSLAGKSKLLDLGSPGKMNMSVGSSPYKMSSPMRRRADSDAESKSIATGKDRFGSPSKSIFPF